MSEYVHFIISWFELDEIRHESREIKVVETTKRISVEFKISRNRLIQLYNFHNAPYQVSMSSTIDFTPIVREQYLHELREISQWKNFELLQLSDKQGVVEDLARYKKLGKEFRKHHPTNL